MMSSTSWVPIVPTCDFSLRNLPYGIFSSKTLSQRIGVAIGDFVLDLQELEKAGIFSSLTFDTSALHSQTLNAYAALDKQIHLSVRQRLTELLHTGTTHGLELRDNVKLRSRALIPLSSVTLHLPMTIGDYTDFFVGYHHAKNCFDMLGTGADFSKLNYVNIPIGYHGRASSIVVSGTPFKRPRGQILNSAKTPTVGPSNALDFEVEFAAFIGKPNKMGDAIDVNSADQHIFGVVLLNDWSARDIQQFESVPLGPFNGKNFCSTISPWVVPLEALESFRTEAFQPKRSNPLPEYLVETNTRPVYDIPITVFITASSTEFPLTTCNTKHVIFSFQQMLAHHTIGGCPMRTGDLISTGTLSGPTPRELGCLLEATLNGSVDYETDAVGETKVTIKRRYLEDGDVVSFRATVGGGSEAGNVGFGLCVGQVI